MNHELIARSLCGRFTPLTEDTGFLESNWWLPSDGTVIGAYVHERGDGSLVISDDGDTLFHVAAGGATINPPRFRRYHKIALAHGFDLSEDGILAAVCDPERLPQVMAQYVQAVHAVATAGVRHRPKDDERFEKLIGGLLEHKFGQRLRRRHELIGISGHQLRFPFAIDIGREREVVIQTISAEDGLTNWKAAYEAGGKFRDAQGARPDLRLVAVLEEAADTPKVSRYFADAADVVVYPGFGELALAA